MKLNFMSFFQYIHLSLYTSTSFEKVQSKNSCEMNQFHGGFNFSFISLYRIFFREIDFTRFLALDFDIMLQKKLLKCTGIIQFHDFLGNNLHQ